MDSLDADKLGVPIRKLFVSNFPFKADTNDLSGLFSQYGPVKDVHIQKKKGGPKAFAFVTFEKEEAAKAARAKPVFMQKRKLLIKPADLWHQPDFKDVHEMTVDKTVEQNTEGLLMLNEDCLLNIFQYLSVQDLLSVEKTCWKLRTVAEMHYKTIREFDFSAYTHLNPMNLRTLIYNIGPYVQTLIVKLLFDNREMQALRFAAQYCTNVRTLHLCGIDLSYKTKNIHQLFRNLTKLIVEACSMTDQTLSYLLRTAENTTLEHLHLSHNSSITGKCLAVFQDQIRVADLSYNSKLSTRHFTAFLKKNPLMEELNIISVDQLEYPAIEQVSKMPHLRKLSISNAYGGVQSVQMVCLKKLQTLRSLRIDYNGYTQLDDMLQQIAESVPLQHLELHGDLLTVRCMDAIMQMKSLTGLVLSHKRDCDDEKLRTLAGLQSLESFTVHSCHRVTNVGVMAIVRENVRLKQLDLFHCELLTADLIQTITEATAKRSHLLNMRVGSMIGVFDDDPYSVTQKMVADNVKVELSSPLSSRPGSSDEASSNSWDDDWDSDEYDYWGNDDHWDHYSSDYDEDEDDYAGGLLLEILARMHQQEL